MTTIALLHGYSSHNSGDELLVRHSLALIREAFGSSAEVTLFASYPESFCDLGVDLVGTRPGRRGWSRRYMRHTIRAFSDFDLVVAVGGGYLRAGHPKELLKTLIVGLPQVLGAARSKRAVYLPQSIGPFMPGTRTLFEIPLSHTQRVYVRDDRSMQELSRVPTVRAPDLAIQYMERSEHAAGEFQTPVFNARLLRGALPNPVLQLASQFERFEGLVQSTVAGNEDSAAVSQLGPQVLLNKREFYSGASPRRVVVAMRLHAALQSLNAGHYVVHLAYERKGYGAFQDLGLPEYVHTSTNFDVAKVVEQIRGLQAQAELRARYDSILAANTASASVWRWKMVEELRRVAAIG